MDSDPEVPLIADGELELHLVERVPADTSRHGVPMYQFEMRARGERVGNASLRLGDGAYFEKYAGHIGYGVDPTFRGHHYAARAVRLLLPLAKRDGLTVLYITCNPENVASRRTCELAGGELIDIVDVPPDTDLYRGGERQKCRYRFVL